ncbi:MAG: peptidase MA family metallohydrolase [Anaerolineae bacterium]
MIRRLISLAAVVVLAACGTVLPDQVVAPDATATAAPPTVTLLPPTPTATPEPTPGATTPPAMPPALEEARVVGPVQVFPGPVHYAGDVLSFEAPLGSVDAFPREEDVLVAIDGGPLEPVQAWVWNHVLLGPRLLTEPFWNTSGEPGTYLVTLSVPINAAGDRQEPTFDVVVLPEAARPLQEQAAEWIIRRTDCCELRYLAGTAAARDIEILSERADQAALYVEDRLGYTVENLPIPIALIDNMWGNGGYAIADGLVVSYIDRDYTGKHDLETFEMLMQHEAVHWATRDLSNETPTMLVEGIAVYITEGHYKPEPIPERTAALVETGLYVPLADLTDNFRAHQHEIAYVQAAGLVAYLTEAYGWDAFLEMYQIDDTDLRNSEWLDNAFRRAYGVGLEQVETDFLAWLAELDTGDQPLDMILTINHFELLRRYQRVRTPYQYFPPISEAIEQGITTPFIRQTAVPEDVAIEAMLVQAAEALHDGDYDTTLFLHKQIDAAIERSDFVLFPARAYLAAAESLTQSGYVVQRIVVSEGETRAVVTRDGDPTLVELVFASGEWVTQ